jgi:PAS domain S-box-containing protein
MNDDRKTKAAVIAELKRVRARVKRLEKSEEKRRLVELALRESEDHYHSIVDNSDIGILLTVPDGRVLSANPAACRMFGRTEAEICRLGHSAFADTTDPRLAPAIEERKRAGSFKGEFTLLRRNGDRFPTEITTTLFHDRNGEPRASIVIRDISVRVRAQEEMRRSEARFRTLIEQAPVAIYVSREGRELYTNKQFRQLLGIPSDEQTAGCKVAQYFAPHCREESDERTRHRSSGLPVPTEFESVLLRRDGSEFPVYVAMGAAELADGLANVAFLTDITERKREIEELNQSEADLSEAQRVAKIGNWTLDIEGNTVRWSEELYRIFDVDKTAFSGMYESFLTCVHPEDRPMMLEANRQSIASGEPFETEYRITTRDGRERNIREVGRAMKAATGKVVRLFGTAQDITERKLAEGALREGEERYRRLVEESPDPIAAQSEGILVYINPAGAKLMGAQSPGELTGRSILDFMHPDGREGALRRLEQLRLGQVVRSDEEKLVTLDGIPIYVELTSIPTTYLGKPAAQIVGRDITERKRAEEELHLLAHTIKSISECVTITDIEGRLIFVNDTFLKTYGYTEAEVLGKTVDFLRASIDDPSIATIHQATLANGWQGELVNRRKDGSEFSLHLSSSVVRDAQAEVVGMVGIARDITERKRAEATQRETTQRLSDLARHLQRVREEEGRRLAREFHDQLGQTLTALKMDLSMLHRHVADTGKELSRSVIGVELQAMQQLIDHAIESVRVIMSELTPELLDQLGIVAALEWEAEKFQRHSDIKCEFESRAQEITLDPTKSIALFRIFQEALTNVARHANATVVRTTVCVEDNHLFLEIRDNGNGIPDGVEGRGRAFGLIGMHERALFLGGSLEIKGVKGEGTTIRVRMPLEQQPQEGQSK